MYSLTLPSNLALDGGGWSTPPPKRFTPGKEQVPLIQEAGWATGPVRTGAEILASHRDSIPGPSNQQRVAIPTELSQPLTQVVIVILKEPATAISFNSVESSAHSHTISLELTLILLFLLRLDLSGGIFLPAFPRIMLYGCLQASAAKQMRSTLFWDVTQSIVVNPYRRFGTAYRPHLQVKNSMKDFLTLEDGTEKLSRNVGKELPLYST